MAVDSMMKRYILATIVAVVATVSLSFAIMYVTRNMSAGQATMVWLSVIGVLILAYLLAKRALLRRQR